jgi:putative ABC transport system ATP-binding protein
MPDLIDAAHLAKSYQRAGATVDVLEDITFTVQRGEFVAIMGASGSGKSTLLNLLGFLARADRGSYRFDGTDYAGATDDVLSRVRNRNIGFVFQQFHLLERTSALENVTLPLLYAEDDVADAQSRARRALDVVGLANRAAHAPGELSGGEQQRVAIARALINNPSLILADEPTGSLDGKSGDEVLALLRSLAEAGRTIVLVTHDPSIASRADRVLVIDNGRIRQSSG